MTSSSLPSFGEADLSNCEREPIHLAGSIQPHGALLVLDDDLTIVQASANAASFLNCAGPLAGRSLSSLPGTMAARIGAHLGEPLRQRAVAVRGRIGDPSIDVDALVHRPMSGGLVVELELVGPSINVRALLDAATQAVLNASSLRALCDEVAGVVERLAGYDRVMVYRFDDLGHGEVYSEVRKPDLEAFLGNRYPASDIPQIARRLYLENRIRLLVDVAYEPEPLEPRGAAPGGELDMSMCGLRSMSPIHLQYLKNMGVRATLVISLVVGGDLWGLIACHNYTPRFVSFETRGVCELFAEIVATRIAALESFTQAQSELVVRRLEQRMVEAIGRDGDWRMALFDGSRTLLQSLNASGAALIYEGQVQTMGDVPATHHIRAIAAWLAARPPEPIVATASLGLDETSFAPLIAVAAGLLASPISATAGEYLVWFRPERVRTVTWGGDPTKPVIVGIDPRQLSPRLSFAQWHQVVEGTSDPWTRSDLTTARLIGDTIADMVVQFRTVRILIAQDQLDHLTRQVRSSRQPMIVADSTGRVLMRNDEFEDVFGPGHSVVTALDELPDMFSEPIGARRALEDLLRRDVSWRGDVALRGADGMERPLTVRGEPVFASLDRKLGYILHFEEITDRKAAEHARRHFQDGMIDRRQLQTSRLGPDGYQDYQSVLASVIENAQLAALEITYGVDADRMPGMLDSVRASVARTADLLEHLLWHAGGTDARRD